VGELLDSIQAAATASPIRQDYRRPPTGFEPGVRYTPDGDVDEVTLALTEIPPDEKAWRAEIMRVTALTIPEGRRVQLNDVRYWGDPHQPMVYVRFAIVDRASCTDPLDLVALMSVARSNRPPRAVRRKRHLEGLRVVVASDTQIGKSASGGGTPALLARVENMLGQLDALMVEQPAEEAITVDPGDLIEGFENVPAQQHTNDLSHPDQLMVARALLTEVVTTVAARHAINRVLTVPSNHAQWRRGKDLIGKPGDDYGIDTHRAVAEALARDRRFREVAFIIPDVWRESLAVHARGAVLGVVHGHRARPGKAWDWWKGQIAGDLPVAAANLLISGHYHSWLTESHGSLNGRPRWFFQADTLDNGSDWWANIEGDQSEPSLMTFTIDDAGRWHNLMRITQATVAEAPSL